MLFCQSVDEKLKNGYWLGLLPVWTLHILRKMLTGTKPIEKVEPLCMFFMTLQILLFLLYDPVSSLAWFQVFVVSSPGGLCRGERMRQTFLINRQISKNCLICPLLIPGIQVSWMSPETFLPPSEFQTLSWFYTLSPLWITANSPPPHQRKQYLAQSHPFISEECSIIHIFAALRSY